MNHFTLVRLNLTRNKLRMCLNVFAILIAFFLFGVLGAIQNAFNAGIELSAADRLVVVNKINFTQTMPVAYVEKIRRIEGVEKLTYANWFGGYYQDPRKQVQTFVVDVESYFQVYSELMVSEEDMENWRRTRQGVMIGRAAADAFGWEMGDKVPLSSNIFSNKAGGQTWEVVIAGIFDHGGGLPTNYVLMHHDYFFETQSYGGEWVGWMVLTTGDPLLNQQVSDSIDREFANSPAETKTSTEAAFSKSFLEQMGDIGFILGSVILAAFFTILLVVGNSMIMAIRERTKEVAVMKTLGFPSRQLFFMVLAESLLLALVGGLLGLLLAKVFIDGMDKVPEIKNMLPNLMIGQHIVVQALLFMLLLGLLTGLIPAVRALRLNIITALSRG